MTLARPLAAAVLLFGLTLAAGCASSTVSGDAVAESAPGPLSEAPVVGAATSAPIDGCALLTAAEVQELIGPNDGGRDSGIDIGGGGCMWQNDSNYYSVTVEVNSVGTAPGGTIPPWDSSLLGEERVVGENMRDINGGIEFAVGNRDALVQVSTTDADADRASALRLIPVIRDRVG